MKTPARISVAWTVILVFSLLMGWVLVRGTAFHQERRLELDWGNAHWVGLAGADEKLYLRRQVVLGSQPRSARLVVAGTDHFELFVNGALIGREDYLGERPSASYDLARLLNPGPNTLAISVTRSSTRRLAQAMAALEWTEGDGVRRLVSDATWRAESRRLPAAAASEEWNAPLYDDSRWPFAQLLAEPPGGDLPQPGSLPPQLFEPAQARWIWHADPQSGVGAFVRELELDTPAVHGGWLGVSVDGVYTPAVNGFVLGTFAGASSRMDAIDIAPYLRAGRNQVELQVSGGRPPMRLAVIGRVLAAQGSVDFSSDERWQSGGGAAIVLSSPESRPPALTALRLEYTQSWSRHRLVSWLGVSAMLAAGVLALGLFATRHVEPALRAQAWMRQAQPWAAAALLLGTAMLANLDPRIRPAPYFSFWLPAGALLVAAVVAWAVARRPVRHEVAA
jgi:hypothetical protein